MYEVLETDMEDHSVLQLVAHIKLIMIIVLIPPPPCVTDTNMYWINTKDLYWMRQTQVQLFCVESKGCHYWNLVNKKKMK